MWGVGHMDVDMILGSSFSACICRGDGCCVLALTVVKLACILGYVETVCFTKSDFNGVRGKSLAVCGLISAI